MEQPKRGLKHVVFFARVAEVPEGSTDAAVASAGLLALRLLDHYFLAGPKIVGADAVGVNAARAEILKLPAGDALRTALFDYVDRLTRIPRDGLALVFPDMFPVAEAYQQKRLPRLAADVYATIAGYAEDKALAANARRMAAEIEARLGTHADS